MAVSAKEIADVIRSKRDDFLREKESLSLKQIRRIVEKTLKLEKKALDGQKALVEQLVDQIVLNAAPVEDVENNAPKPKAQKTQPPTGKKRKADVDLDDQQGSDEDDFCQPNKAAIRQKETAGKKRKKIVKEQVLEEEENDSPAPTRKKGKKKQSVAVTAAPDGGKAGAGMRKHDAQVQRLQRVCKAAGIGISPHTYIQNKDPGSLKAALQDLLRKHGLTVNSEASKLAAVRARLELARDMEGIDMSNIIDDGDAGRGGRPSRRAAANVHYRSLLKSEEDSEEDEGEEDADQDSEDNPSSEDGSDDDISDEMASDDAAAASDEDEPPKVAQRKADNTAASKKGRLKRAAGKDSDDELAVADELGDDSDGDDPVDTRGAKQSPAKQQQQEQRSKPGKHDAAAAQIATTKKNSSGNRKQQTTALEALQGTDDSTIRDEEEEEEEAEVEQLDRDEDEESEFEDVEDDD